MQETDTVARDGTTALLREGFEGAGQLQFLKAETVRLAGSNVTG
ncbi:hypothetical protein ACFOUR_11740 [Halovivax cerinus]|uniref:Uncharacterized protein n=1 Tax=Halovivax cerinus TaxID=1487865 RepID=A0ABD5NPW8_9EURY